MPNENNTENQTPEEGSSRRKIDILPLLWKLHPFLFLGLAIILGLFAYNLIPKKVTEKPKTLTFYYDRSVAALNEASNPLLDNSEGRVQEAIQKAKTDFEYVFTHKSYRDQMDNAPELTNPYMLFGESLFLYGTNDRITQNKANTFQRAVWAFAQAIEWETKHWDEREQKIYDTQYFTDDEPYDEKVLAARKLLRNQYMRYMLARSAIYAGQYYLAESELDSLIKQFQVENLSNNELWKTVESLPPHKYELLPEDRTLLYFFLAELSEKRNEVEKAEKYYRIFLLHANRSKEYFQALMRLGDIYFSKAKIADDKNNIEEARRLYSEAAEIFSKVVAASPPSNILRRAYFTGGRAYYNMALTIPTTENSIWDISEKFSDKIKFTMQDFSNGNLLPPRSLFTPIALGRAISQSGIGSLTPFTLITENLIGGSLTLLSKERLTPESEKRSLLWKANMYFSGSQGGKLQEYDGPANIMLARIHMINGNYSDARKLLIHTRTYFWSPEIEVASKLGIAISYLMEGELDRSAVRFLGGPEKTSSSLLTIDDIKSWEGLCEKIFKETLENTPNPGKRLWALLPKNMQDIIQNVATTGKFSDRYKPIFIRRMNEVLSSEEFYSKKSFANLELPATAYALLDKDISLLTIQNRQWLNRMLLDSNYRTYILPTDSGSMIDPFPSASDFAPFDNSVLLTKNRVIQSLRTLSEEYTKNAQEASVELDTITYTPDASEIRLLASAPRRDLSHATEINEFLINEYTPEYIGDIMMENADLYKKRAQLAGAEPFRNIDLARKLTAIAADKYMLIGKSGDYLSLEQKALIEAGRNYYAANKYGKASEALVVFVANYPSSSQIGWASNLLGRCYWYLKRFNDAIMTYRNNSSRRTPDGRNSLYYLGAVYLDAEEIIKDNTLINVVGNPDAPYAKEDKDGDVYPDTALQVFNEVRRQEGIAPSSRPWRWATFGLGKVWFYIAEKARFNELTKAEAEKREPNPIEWRDLYQKAADMLREGLERYKLKYSANDQVGISLNEEPEDYYDVMRERMQNEYFLALALRVLSRNNTSQDDNEVRTLLENVINQELYPNTLLELDTDKLLLGNRSVIGVNAGPVVNPKYLQEIRRNSFFLLADSWSNLGRLLMLDDPPKRTSAIDAFEKALQVYRRSRDRLSIYDGPRILYNIGETMINLGRADDAKRMFLMVITQTDQIIDSANSNISQELKDEIQNTLIWKELAQNRLKDLQNNLIQ